MFRLIVGFLFGLLAGWALLLLPAPFLLVMLLIFVGLAGAFFLLFHLGLRDFQEY